MPAWHINSFNHLPTVHVATGAWGLQWLTNSLTLSWTADPLWHHQPVGDKLKLLTCRHLVWSIPVPCDAFPLGNSLHLPQRTEMDQFAFQHTSQLIFPRGYCKRTWSLVSCRFPGFLKLALKALLLATVSGDSSHICWLCISGCDLPVGPISKFGTCGNNIGKSINIPNTLGSHGCVCHTRLTSTISALSFYTFARHLPIRYNPAPWSMAPWTRPPAMPLGLASNSQTSRPVHFTDLQTSLPGSDPKSCLAAWTLRASTTNCWSPRIFKTACPPPDSNALASVLL